MAHEFPVDKQVINMNFIQCKQQDTKLDGRPQTDTQCSGEISKVITIKQESICQCPEESNITRM